MLIVVFVQHFCIRGYSMPSLSSIKRDRVMQFCVNFPVSMIIFSFMIHDRHEEIVLKGILRPAPILRILT